MTSDIVDNSCKSKNKTGKLRKLKRNTIVVRRGKRKKCYKIHTQAQNYDTARIIVKL